MSTIAFDQFALTRIADFARSLSRLHQASRRQAVDDDAIDREFNAVCMSVWGYTTDDFSDALFCDADHAWLDSLDEAHARIFAAEHGYDLVDDQGMLTDWWGYCWMILAEKRPISQRTAQPPSTSRQPMAVVSLGAGPSAAPGWPLPATGVVAGCSAAPARAAASRSTSLTVWVRACPLQPHPQLADIPSLLPVAKRLARSALRSLDHLVVRCKHMGSSPPRLARPCRRRTPPCGP